MDTTTSKFPRVFITGGAGYVGSLLVPTLLAKGYHVTVYDLYLYGDVLKQHPNLVQIKGDIRDREFLIQSAANADAMIHLACISNDPSFDLDPQLGKSINYDAFQNVIDACTQHSIKRLIVASSTSQYGIKPVGMDVTEEASAEPITDYAKYKIMCENLLRQQDVGTLEYVFVRPATLCGYAPRLRLDLSVNILTTHALVNKKIRIFGGSQMRPALNIKDMVRFYELLLEAPREKIHGQAFNVAYKNVTIKEIAEQVRETLADPSIQFEIVPTEDIRSYHVNCDKMKRLLGFECQYDFADAIKSLQQAYSQGKIVDGLNNPLYWNIKRMKEINLESAEVFKNTIVKNTTAAASNSREHGEKVLVLGSNSFSGAHYVDLLLERGMNVIGVSRSPEKSSLYLPYLSNAKLQNFTFYRYDLNKDLNELLALIAKEKPAYIVNFASQSIVGYSWKHPDHWYRTNVLSTVKLVNALKDLDFLKKYVHISTPEVYGTCKGLVQEDHPFNPSTPYAGSRAAADDFIKMLIAQFNFPAVFTRAANVFGPSQQLFKIIPRAIIYAKKGMKVPLHGGGYAKRSFIHIRDVCEGTLQVMLHGTIGEVYHLSTDELTSIRDLVAMIGSKMGVRFEDLHEDAATRRGLDDAYILDSSKAKSSFGWQCKYTLDQALEETVSWVNEHWEEISSESLDYIHQE